LAVNAKVATALGAIPASSDTADDAVLNNVYKNKKYKNLPLKFNFYPSFQALCNAYFSVKVPQLLAIRNRKT
jgi:hypothetical protein